MIAFAFNHNRANIVNLRESLSGVKSLRKNRHKSLYKRTSEGKRMASGHTGNVVPRKGLRVRISCPPL